MPNQDDIADWIIRFIADRTGVPAHEIELDENLGSYGLSSMHAVDLIGSLEDTFGLALPAALVFQFPSVDELSSAIAQRLAGRVATAAAGE